MSEASMRKEDAERVFNEPPDTLNRCLVGLIGDKIAVAAFGRALTRNEAMNLAAWLVVHVEMVDSMNDPGDDFDKKILAREQLLTLIKDCENA